MDFHSLSPSPPWYPLCCWCFVVYDFKELPLNCLTCRISPNEITNSVTINQVLRFPSLSLHWALNPMPFIKQTPNRHCLAKWPNVAVEISTWCQSWIAWCCIKRTVNRGWGLDTFPIKPSLPALTADPVMYSSFDVFLPQLYSCHQDFITHSSSELKRYPFLNC